MWIRWLNNMEQLPEGKLVLEPVAWYRGQLKEKFGLPRQAGLVPELSGYVEMAEGFRNKDMFRGLEGFSHIWLVWGFSKNHTWSPTVRPPRLGGNERLGVFATRSPFRPNPVGLSLVELAEIQWDAGTGPRLLVKGADLLDGTPIYDIKPYVPYADARPEARGGFAAAADTQLPVRAAPGVLALIPEQERPALLGVLAQDPRPHYQHDPERVYGLSFENWNVRFKIGEQGVEIISIEKI